MQGFPPDIPFRVVGKDICLTLTAQKSDDSIVEAYVFAGFFFTDIKVFKASTDPSKKNVQQIEVLKHSNTSIVNISIHIDERLVFEIRYWKRD